MKNVSIEYAHIYTNQRITEEHQTCLGILDELKSSLAADKTSSMVVMIDDYSFPDPTFNYTEFFEWLGQQGHKPDLLIRESQLIPICDQVLGLVEDESLKQQITDYIKSKKYPCSLFIAAWYLSRLGRIDNSIVPKAAQAKKLINILPDSFRPFEDKGLEIISATRHKDCVQFIEYRFIPGRLIA